MDKRKAPLKNIIGTDNLGREILECGHHIYAPQDIAGRVEANQRRCWKCSKLRMLMLWDMSEKRQARDNDIERHLEIDMEL